jgi:hypothetical protein
MQTEPKTWKQEVQEATAAAELLPPSTVEEARAQADVPPTDRQPALKGRMNNPLTSRVEALKQLQITMPLSASAQAFLGGSRLSGELPAMVKNGF